MTLPPVPKSLGSIRHVFTSALDASLGRSQHLNLKTKTHYCVVMVDGLGYENLIGSKGYSRFLAASTNLRSINAAFPTTTANNLMSFASGLQTGQHGFLGHQIFERNREIALNLLTGWGEENPEDWNIPSNVSSRALAAGVQVNFIAAAEYQFTGYTRATMAQAQFVATDALAERFEAASRIFRGPTPSISYLYIPELDKQAHRTGWKSDAWSAQLEEVDGLMRRFIGKMPANSAVILTADHGMVDSAAASKIMVDEFVDNSRISWVGGDPRAPYFYLDSPDSTLQVLDELRENLAGEASFFSAQQLVDSGWYGSFSDSHLARLPDVIGLASRENTLFHKDFSKPRSIAMIGHHGGVSAAEVRVPLIVWGA